MVRNLSLPKRDAMIDKACIESAFPKFSDEQMERVAACPNSELVSFADGETLVDMGQRDFPFYVIKSGNVEILETSSGHPKFIASHVPGEFTGDVDMLTARPALFTAVARGPCETYRIPAAKLRQLLNEVPEMSDMLLNAFQLRRKILEESGVQGMRVVGPARSRETMHLREFFYRNHVVHHFFDTNEPEGQEQLRELGATMEDAPVVACHERVLKRPSVIKIAECLGISRQINDALYDLVIVGAGPAGLSAAVYAGSEGLSTLVIDGIGPGGQAGSSSRIENFMGFPSGISGSELANRGYLQALKFGAQFTAPVRVLSLEHADDGLKRLRLCTGQTARARAVLIASGVSCRQLDAEGCQRFEGAGVYYAATTVESRICSGGTAVIVGGGNSAGQAAMYLAQFAREVKLVIRGNDLGKSMSQYLCRRIEQHPSIEVVYNSEVDAADGEDALQRIRLRNNRTGEMRTIPCAALFIFIGAKPHTEWLPSCVKLDDKGFVLTGASVRDDPLWSDKSRDPCELETTAAGVMAAGDVRAGTTKRCGFAVGDGPLAISCVHRYLDKLWRSGATSSSL